jgi:hypothetical protein
MATGRSVAAAFGLVALLSSPSWAAEASLICVNAGHDYRVGDYACIAACHGKRRYARCDVIAEKTSWTFISDACPSANLTPPDPKDTTLAPVETAMTPIPLIITMSAIDPAIQTKIAATRQIAATN